MRHFLRHFEAGMAQGMLARHSVSISHFNWHWGMACTFLVPVSLIEFRFQGMMNMAAVLLAWGTDLQM